ncbi:MAG: GNAT family protein [Pseudomonadota bacterium]
MIKVRDYREADIPALVELANNENVSRYLVYTFPYPYTLADARWWIDTGASENGSVTKAIEFEGAFVGSVGITPDRGWKSHSAEIGYWVGEPYWGQGIATQALRTLTSHAFRELGFQRLIAPVLSPNKASMAVLEKCGYACEGVLRSDVYKSDTYYDIHHYAKNRFRKKPARAAGD